MDRPLDGPALVRGEGTILARFREACRRFPDRDALVFLGTRFTYEGLLNLVGRFAAALEGLGLRPGDRVLVYLPNSPQWLAAYLGTQSMGGVPVPVSPIYTPRELRYLLVHCGARAVVCADTNFGYVEEAASGEGGVEHVIVSALGDLLPVWKRAIGRLFDRLPRGRVRPGPRVRAFRSLIRGHEPRHGLPRLEPEADLAHMLYTGGTMGFPKGVPHTHAELLTGVGGLRELYRPVLRDGGHTLVVPLQLFHMFTQDMVVGLGLHLGNTVVILPRPDIDAVLWSVDHHGGTLLIGVPTLYRKILENDRLELYELGSLRYCWSAGDVLPAETAARWRERFGLPIHQVYGSTETVCVAASPLGRDPDHGTVGRLLSTREARVLDPETLEDVGPGESGELMVTSDYSYGAGGYWRNPEETERTYVTLAGRTWCRTGDFVRLRAGGEIDFVDRSADLIKHKGFRVSAARVESVLQDHPAVMAAAVVGTPDPVAGENVKAFVILDDSVRGVTAFDLTRHCRDRLLPYEVPDYIEFRDMLPKSKVGKLLRRELREEERRRMGGLAAPRAAEHGGGQR